MDIRQLRYFSAVYERRNLSHAAQQCCVAQSALSHHLSRLEDELGTRLFERMARGMEPTPAGTRLYEHAQLIINSLSAAVSDVQQMSETISGEMQLGLPHTVLSAIAVPLLRTLKADLPDARVMIHETFSSELYRQLLQGDHDLILCYNAPQNERLKLTYVHDEPLCCVGVPELVGGDDAPITVEAVLQLPHIVAWRGDDARSISVQPRFIQSLQNQSVFEMNSINGMREAISAGLGVIVCPLITVRDLVIAKRVVARPIVEPITTRSLHTVRLVERLPTRLMTAVQSIVLNLIKQQRESGAWPTIRDQAAGRTAALG